MAFAAVDATDSSRMRRGISLGPIKMQFLTYTCLSTDTSGTVTADGMAEITAILIDGVQQSAAATFSGNVATLAFVCPTGSTTSPSGDIIVFGV